jgi:hypothetical protein
VSECGLPRTVLFLPFSGVGKCLAVIRRFTEQYWKGVIRTGIHTLVFFANYELLIQDYVSYLTKTTLVSNCLNHVVLMSSSGTVNQYQYTKRVSSVVAYWTRTHRVIGSNPGQVKTSLYGPIASGASVDPTSQVCSSAILVLPIVGH